MTLRPFSAIAGGENTPNEPDWRSIYQDELDVATAGEAWGLVVREMRDAGTLATANGHAIKRLVEFRVQYDRAARQIADEGTIIKAKRTRTPRGNPYWTVMRQADEVIRALEAELGIAPVRRGKAAKINRVQKAPRAADSYLGSKKVS